MVPCPTCKESFYVPKADPRGTWQATGTVFVCLSVIVGVVGVIGMLGGLAGVEAVAVFILAALLMHTGVSVLHRDSLDRRER